MNWFTTVQKESTFLSWLMIVTTFKIVQFGSGFAQVIPLHLQALNCYTLLQDPLHLANMMTVNVKYPMTSLSRDTYKLGDILVKKKTR